jgi:hypothetical protein
MLDLLLGLVLFITVFCNWDNVKSSILARSSKFFDVLSINSQIRLLNVLNISVKVQKKWIHRIRSLTQYLMYQIRPRIKVLLLLLLILIRSSSMTATTSSWLFFSDRRGTTLAELLVANVLKLTKVVKPLFKGYAFNYLHCCRNKE